MPTGIYDRSKAKPRKKRSDKPQAATSKAPAKRVHRKRAAPDVKSGSPEPMLVIAPSFGVELPEPLYTWLKVTSQIRGNISIAQLVQDAVTLYIREGA